MRKFTHYVRALCVLLLAMYVFGCGGADAVAVVQNSIPAEVVDRMVWSPISVALVDESGDPVPDSGIPVTVSLGQGSGSIMGTTVRTSVAGHVTFDDLAYVTDAAVVMETITLVFNGPGITEIESDEIEVLLPYQIDGGADQEFSYVSATASDSCNFIGNSYFVQLVGFRDLPDLGQIVFGADTILGGAGAPPVTMPIPDAPVLVTDVPQIFTLRFSDVPIAEAFDSPDAVVALEDGVATLSTGADGVAYMLLRLEQEALLGVGESESYMIHLDPLVPGAGITVTLNFTCNAP